jgi:acetyl-CoA carboxylase carboxyl transferase subunit alpha
MGLTADRLLKLNLIDGIVAEPPGGAHRDLERMVGNLRTALCQQLQPLTALAIDELLEQRYRRLMAYGVFREAAPATPAQSSWSSSVVALLGKDNLLSKD